MQDARRKRRREEIRREAWGIVPGGRRCELRAALVQVDDAGGWRAAWGSHGGGDDGGGGDVYHRPPSCCSRKFTLNFFCTAAEAPPPKLKPSMLLSRRLAFASDGPIGPDVDADADDAEPGPNRRTSSRLP